MSAMDVTVHTEAAEWWQIVVALTPLAAVPIAAITFWFACRRQPTDRWGRIEWALNLATDGNPQRRRVGLAALEQLSADQFVRNEDAQIIAQARALLTEQ